MRKLCILAAMAALLLFTACDTNKFAIRVVADALSSTGSGGDEGSTFTRDDDPELVAAALPTFIKTLELILSQDPDHEALGITTGSTLISYASVVLMDRASYMLDDQIDQKETLYQEAKKLFLRGRNYVLHVLELRYPGFRAALEGEDYAHSVDLCSKKDLDALYWATAGWVAAFSADTFDFELQLTVPRAEHMMRKARDLDPSFMGGAIWDFYVSYYASLPANMGGDRVAAKEAWKKCYEINKGEVPGIWLSWALNFSLPEGNRPEFEEFLGKALAIDIEKHPESRLTSVLAQRKAKWLLGQIDTLFPEPQSRSQS